MVGIDVEVSFQRKPPGEEGGGGVLSSFYNGLYGKGYLFQA